VTPDLPTIGVLLADDHVLLRHALKLVLEQHGYRVLGEASDGHAAVNMCDEIRPQVAVLDIGMPLLNGIEAAQEIAKRCPCTKIVLLTMYAEHSYVVAALQAGVAGYVLKNSAAMSLVQAIEAVLAGDTYLSPGVSRIVVEGYLASHRGPSDPLSTRERQVLRFIAEGKNMKEIGDLLSISARTAETHRTRLMTKLNIHDVAGLVRYAIQHGLLDLNQTAGSGS
jgi:DNA-binding NarL/FixJ family response regulator